MVHIRPPPTRSTQRTIEEWATGDATYRNIAAAGDRMEEREATVGIFRVGYQNINGSDMESGIEVAQEIDAMLEIGADLQGMSEMNKPWSDGNKWRYRMQLDAALPNARPVFAAMEADFDVRRQQGGNLQVVAGREARRLQEEGSDKKGRFCYQALRGKRDEGVVFITAYRVCQEASDNPGPDTTYMREFLALREKGVEKPNPRKQILKDLGALIRRQRELGFRPVLMMDANGDAYCEKGQDKDLARFMEENNLDDPYRERYEGHTRTYMYGRRRLDYILMDPVIAKAVINIGYLATHEGAMSDVRRLFRGAIHRPVEVHSRDFMINQSDKNAEFQRKMVETVRRQEIGRRVQELAMRFKKKERTERNVADYQQLDKEIMDIVLGTAHKVARRKYGYMRSDKLTRCGRTVLLHKMILDCVSRKVESTGALRRLANAMEVDVEKIREKGQTKIRKDMYAARKELWQAQKRSEADMSDWLREVAQKRVEAVGDREWQRNVSEMIRTTDENAMNRKLGIITKGQRSGGMDRIEVANHDWYLSTKNKEIYNYEEGNFKAHTERGRNQYHEHHTLKVLPGDAVKVRVRRHSEAGWEVVETLEWYQTQDTARLYRRRGEGMETYRKAKDGTYYAAGAEKMPKEAEAVRVTETGDPGITGS